MPLIEKKNQSKPNLEKQMKSCLEYLIFVLNSFIRLIEVDMPLKKKANQIKTSLRETKIKVLYFIVILRLFMNWNYKDLFFNDGW